MAQQTHMRQAYWSVASILDGIMPGAAPRALETIRYFVAGGVAVIGARFARSMDGVIVVGTLAFVLAQFGGLLRLVRVPRRIRAGRCAGARRLAADGPAGAPARLWSRRSCWAAAPPSPRSRQPRSSLRGVWCARSKRSPATRAAGRRGTPRAEPPAYHRATTPRRPTESASFVTRPRLALVVALALLIAPTAPTSIVILFIAAAIGALVVSTRRPIERATLLILLIGALATRYEIRARVGSDVLDVTAAAIDRVLAGLNPYGVGYEQSRPPGVAVPVRAARDPVVRPGRGPAPPRRAPQRVRSSRRSSPSRAASSGSRSTPPRRRS